MASTASLPPPGSAVPDDHYHSDETAADEYPSPDDHTTDRTKTPRPPWRAAAVAAAALGSRLRNSLYEYYDLS